MSALYAAGASRNGGINTSVVLTANNLVAADVPDGRGCVRAAGPRRL